MIETTILIYIQIASIPNDETIDIDGSEIRSQASAKLYNIRNKLLDNFRRDIIIISRYRNFTRRKKI